MDAIRWNLKGSVGFQIFRIVLIIFMGLGIYAYSHQARYGLAVTGMNDIVSWGFYISNFTFLVGVAAAAVMLDITCLYFSRSGFPSGCNYWRRYCGWGLDNVSLIYFGRPWRSAPGLASDPRYRYI